MSKNFTDVFNEAVNELKRSAEAKGVSLRALCTAANMSRATPDRWTAKTPHTIELVTRLQKLLDDMPSRVPTPAFAAAEQSQGEAV